MTLTEQAALDAQAVAEAQNILAAASAKAATSAAALAAMQPAISMLDQIGADISGLDLASASAIGDTLAKLRAYLNV